MKEIRLKIGTLLFVLLVLDLIKPFCYSLRTEFIFVGLMVLFLNYPLSVFLPIVIIFGYLKDIFSEGVMPFNLLEVILLSFLARYIDLRFGQKNAKIFIALIVIIIHISLNIIKVGAPANLNSLLFFTHTLALFLLAERPLTVLLNYEL